LCRGASRCWRDWPAAPAPLLPRRASTR
jgi:hypothetical protein